jgi:asparagine synthase (glutamine-hydrolysing)
MCGITGVLMKTGNPDPERVREGVQRMTAQVMHRGPDAGGVKVIGPVGLGHRRLAIIDLNERSTQPMSVAEETVWIVFNGEIYNYLELRAELKAKGCQFRTESDTEVILQGWRIWGEDMVRRLHGMFAFALWDDTSKTMLLARDRFGKKPLFYAERSDWVLFASEIKSFLEWPGFERRVNLRAIHDYLTYRYCIGQDSAFEGVRKVPPAHYMIFQLGRAPRLERYWTLAGVSPRQAKTSIDDLAHELVDRLDDAIRCRMISDVPLGAFLSGGVDSSAVVARMATLSKDPVKTFSVGFAIEGYDETPYAEEIAQLFHTEHHRFIMDYGLIRELPRLVWHYGEPYADSSALVTYALAREIRKHVTVALSGDGGDEIFLGYGRYSRFKDSVAAWRAGMRPRLPFQPMLGGEGPFHVRDHYVRSISVFQEEHKQTGYGPNLANFLFLPSMDQLGLGLEEVTPETAIDLAARAEVDTYLPDDLLVKADIATMAASVEGRSPLLDHQLADWAASLPQEKRVFERNGVLEMKALLKYAFEPYLPAKTLYRRKQGFSVPVAHWMRHEIKDFMMDLLTSTRFKQRGLVTPAFVDRMMQRHFADREDHGTRLWALLCLELWFQTFIDRSEAGPLDVDVMAPGSAAGLRLAS